MTTNQTIDGVPRALLDLCYRALNGGDNHLSGMEHGQAFRELRALLDAKEVLVVPLTGPKEWLDSLKPAAQPQGEPVAWIVTDINGDSYFAYDKQTPNDKPLYAEQPAPVALVLPERKTWDGLRATACNLKAEAWNACLDEVIRLNPSL